MSDPINPSHYKRYPFEVITLTRDMSFVFGNIVKYLLRAPFKGKLTQDLKKAAWYACYLQMSSKYHTDEALDLVYLHGSHTLPHFISRADLLRIEATFGEHVGDDDLCSAMIMSIRLFHAFTNPTAEERDDVLANFRKFVESVVKLARKADEANIQ